MGGHIHRPALGVDGADHGVTHPMAGKGLILGMDEEGEAADTKITVEEVEKQIEWIDNIRFISDKIKLNAQQHGAQL